MREDNDHEPLTCSDLELDQEKIASTYTDTIDQLVRCLMYHFGKVQVRGALHEGIKHDFRSVLHSFARGITHEISGAYTEKALASAHAATANMFEALAAGAHIVHRTAATGEDVAGVAHAFAAIAACEGRPEILKMYKGQGTK